MKVSERFPIVASLQPILHAEIIGAAVLFSRSRGRRLQPKLPEGWREDVGIAHRVETSRNRLLLGDLMRLHAIEVPEIPIHPHLAALTNKMRSVEDRSTGSHEHLVFNPAADHM